MFYICRYVLEGNIATFYFLSREEDFRSSFLKWGGEFVFAFFSLGFFDFRRGRFLWFYK